MASILESLGSTFSPDVVADIGKALGADTGAISKGLAAVSPLLLSGMAKTATASPGGAEALMKMLPESGGLFGNLGGLLGSVLGGAGSGASGAASTLLGPGVNAIGGALSRALGFNVTPLLGLVAPALLGMVGKTVASQKLDAGRLASMLGKEVDAFGSDPANQEAAALVLSATKAGDQASAMIGSYGDSWKQVVAGPAAALFAVSTADLSGPIGSVKEAQAAGKVLLDATKGAEPTSVLAAAFAGGLTPDMASLVKELAPTKEKLIDVARAGLAAVKQRSPEQAQGYKDTILAVAKAAAEASKEGGFLGFGGKLVSEEEQAALAALQAALA